MKVSIHPATLRDASYIACNLRAEDKREIEAVATFGSPAELAAWSLHFSGDRAYVAMLNGQPVCAMGLVPQHEGCLTGWAWGTDRMWRALPKITEFCLASWMRLQTEGIRRIEVRSIVDHDIAHRWLEMLGAKPEGIARKYGRNGEDFITYSLVRD